MSGTSKDLAPLLLGTNTELIIAPKLRTASADANAKSDALSRGSTVKTQSAVDGKALVLHVLASPIHVHDDQRRDPVRAYVSRKTFAALTGCLLSELCASSLAEHPTDTANSHVDLSQSSDEEISGLRSTSCNVLLHRCRVSRLQPPLDPSNGKDLSQQKAPDPLAIALKEHLVKEATSQDPLVIELACVPDAQVVVSSSSLERTPSARKDALLRALVPDGCVAFSGTMLGEGKGKLGLEVGDVVRWVQGHRVRAPEAHFGQC
jgi:hypothetical protein